MGPDKKLQESTADPGSNAVSDLILNVFENGAKYWVFFSSRLFPTAPQHLSYQFPLPTAHDQNKVTGAPLAPTKTLHESRICNIEV